jgi:hypothetical protein
MSRAWVALGLTMLLGGCMRATSSVAVRETPPATPTQLDYVVFASMADTSMPLALAGYREPTAFSEVAVQLH